MYKANYGNNIKRKVILTHTGVRHARPWAVAHFAHYLRHHWQDYIYVTLVELNKVILYSALNFLIVNVLLKYSLIIISVLLLLQILSNIIVHRKKC
jgi:hypothetical protein